MPIDNNLEIRVRSHLSRYRKGLAACPRICGVVGERGAAYLAEWDRQCLELRRRMFCRKVA